MRLKKLIDESRAEQKAQEELFAKEKPLFLSVRSIALDTNPNLAADAALYAIKKGCRDKLVELLYRQRARRVNTCAQCRRRSTA